MRVLFVTCTAEAADELALALLREKRIACCNIVPGVRSHYWWEGEIQSDSEVVMLMECAAADADATVKRVRELHPYDVPKIVTLSPDACDEDYLNWVRSVTDRSGDRSS